MSYLFLLGCIAFATADETLPDALVAALPAKSPTVELRKLEERERSLLRRFVADAIQNRIEPSAVAQLSEVGWELSHHQHEGESVWLLVERADAQHGRGVLAVRAESTNRFFVQTPHRFFDSRTGAIAVDWFLKTNLRMAYWNTVHRNQIDLAHSDQDTVLDLLTQSFDTSVNDGIVLQLHGFVAAKRKTQLAQEAEVILSGGTVEPVERHYNARLFVRRSVPESDVFLYPVDVKALGATTNKQRRLLPKPESFLHIELSMEFRRRLLKDPQQGVEILKQLFQLHRI